jgi:hypothetical protein
VSGARHCCSLVSSSGRHLEGTSRLREQYDADTLSSKDFHYFVTMLMSHVITHESENVKAQYGVGGIAGLVALIPCLYHLLCI